jgi:hypothetical protein
MPFLGLKNRNRRMKKEWFVVFILVLTVQLGYSQKVKTGVLVIGNGNNALGAGFQSAVSGVKTILLMENQNFEMSEVHPLDKNLSSGLEAEFLKRMRKAKGIKDTSKVYIDQTSANAVIKTWADSTKNLTIIRAREWSKLKRAGGGWSIQLSDGRTIRAAVLVHADASGKVNEALLLPKMKENQWKALDYKDNLYRTSISSGFSVDNSSSNVLPLYNLLIPEQENLVVLNPDQQSIAAGQSAGATAAYAAFFDLKTSQSNLKKIQGELISYRLSILPFEDVVAADSNWKAVQFIGLSGFLKGALSSGRLTFVPNREVSTEEIKEPIKEYFYKAQIWFEDYKGSQMTISSTLDLVSKIGNKSPENTLTEVKKKWKTTYGFKTEFEPSRNITRREFAVLVYEYLNPFNVNVDSKGRVVR